MKSISLELLHTDHNIEALGFFRVDFSLLFAVSIYFVSCYTYIFFFGFTMIVSVAGPWNYDQLPHRCCTVPDYERF